MNILDKGAREAIDRVCEFIGMSLMDRSTDREERAVKCIPDLPAPFMTANSIVVCCQALLNSIKVFREKKADMAMSVGLVTPDYINYEVRAAADLSRVLKPEWVPEEGTIDVWWRICNEGVIKGRDRLHTVLTDRTEFELRDGVFHMDINDRVVPNGEGDAIKITSLEHVRNLVIPVWTERLLLLAIVNLPFRSIMLVQLHYATEEDKVHLEEMAPLIV